MKWDRVAVFLVTTTCCAVANLLPTTLGGAYGCGFPMKWTYDPASLREPQPDPPPSRPQVATKPPPGPDPDPPYAAPRSPRDRWTINDTALAVDVGLALAVVGLALAINELWQTSQGNRQQAGRRPG